MKNFLITYINKFRLTSIEHNDFKAHLIEKLTEKYGPKHQEEFKKIKWEEWMYNTGNVPQVPAFD